MCFPGSSPLACQNASYKAYNSRRKERLQYRRSAGKIRMQKMKPSYEQSPGPGPFVTPAGIRHFGSWSKFVMQK